MQKTKGSSIRIRLNDDDKRQKICLKLFECAGYKRNQLLGIMAEELVDKYGISVDKMSPSEISAFITSYDFIKSAQKNSGSQIFFDNPIYQTANMVPLIPASPPEPSVQSSQETDKGRDEKPAPASKVEIDSNKEMEFDEELSKNVLSAFGI